MIDHFRLNLFLSDLCQFLVNAVQVYSYMNLVWMVHVVLLIYFHTNLSVHSAVISSCGGHQVGVTFIVRVSFCIHTAEILKILEYENVKRIAFDLVSFHQIMCAFASSLLHF